MFEAVLLVLDDHESIVEGPSGKADNGERINRPSGNIEIAQ